MRQDDAKARLDPLETADLQSFVIALSDALAPVSDPRLVEQIAVTRLGERLGADRVVYVDIDGDFSTVRQDYTRGVRSLAGRWAARDLGALAPFRAGQRGTTVFNDIAGARDLAPEVRSAYHKIEVGSKILITRARDGRPVASFAVHMKTPRAWSPLEVQFVEATAERLWHAMERAKLIDALRESDARHTFLLELGDALRALDDPDAVAQTALERLRACIGADHVGLAHADSAGAKIVFEDRGEGCPSLLGQRFTDADFPTAFSELRRGNSFVAEELEDVRHFPPDEAERYRALGYRRQITQPVLRDGELVAVLSARFREPGPWNARDLRFAKDTAERAWTAIERARREREMRRRESELAYIQSIAGFASFSRDLTNDLPVARSPEYALLHGLEPGKSVEDPGDWRRRMHPEDRERATGAFFGAIQRGERIYQSEYRIVRPVDGKIRWLYSIAEIEFDAAGKPVSVMGANIDITERKRAEQTLLDSEARSRLLLNGFQPTFWETDAAGGLVYRRPPGPDPEEEVEARMLGEGWLNQIHPDDRARARENWRRAHANGVALNEEYRVDDGKDGYRWINARAMPVTDRDGALIKYVGMSINIDAQKRSEQRLRASERRMRRFADASSDALWIRNADTLAFESVSRAFGDVFGIEGAAVLPPADPRQWMALIVPEDRKRALSSLECVRQGRTATYEFCILRPRDGEFRWIRSTDFPLFDDDGRVTHIAGIATDVTDSRQSAARQSVLLAELQHRVRNVMAIVLSMTARTARSARSVEDYAALLHGRLSAIARTQSLITRAAAAGVDLRGILEEEIAAQSAPDARYEIAGPPVSLPPKAAEVMTLAIHELTTNALKHGALAAPDGRIDVNWRLERREDQPWLVFEWRERGAAARQDARPARRGFGSELIVQRVPYELRGSGTLEIRPEGAFCQLEFPVESTPSPLETDAPPMAAPYSGALNMSGEPSLAGVSVLIVEDDFLLANDLERALKAAGASVLGPAADLRTAARLIEASVPQAAVLDVDLSGDSGLKALRLLRQFEVPTVVVSGYDEARLADLPIGCARVQKPADLRLVVRAIANRALSPTRH